VELSTENFKLCIVEGNLGCIRLGFDTLYCAVGEYRSSMFLRDACNTYCKTTKCRDASTTNEISSAAGTSNLC